MVNDGLIAYNRLEWERTLKQGHLNKLLLFLLLIKNSWEALIGCDVVTLPYVLETIDVSCGIIHYLV